VQLLRSSLAPPEANNEERQDVKPARQAKKAAEAEIIFTHGLF